MTGDEAKALLKTECETLGMPTGDGLWLSFDAELTERGGDVDATYAYFQAGVAKMVSVLGVRTS